MNQEQFKNLFGKRLRQALIERDLKQRDLAEAINVSEKQVSVYTSGNGLPTVYGLLLICKELSISADFLLGLINKLTTVEYAEDPLEEEILMMRQSYIQMSKEMRIAFQDLVKAILTQK